LGLRELPAPIEPGGAIGAELQAALAGRYGAATRVTPGQRSVTLFSAVPVRDGEAVIGAVVVSQSTFRILQALYDVRLRVFQIVVASLVAAAIVTVIATTTIVRPLAKLRRAAGAVADRRQPGPSAFPGAGRRDEIGELARALTSLSDRLNAHIALLEGFAADVSHEFRNPLAAIRSAAETIEQSDSDIERRRFLGLMIRDVDRLERLVSGLRELVRVDGRLARRQTERCALTDLVRAVAGGLRLPDTARVRVNVESTGPCHVAGDPDALTQVIENLVANALSFAPVGSSVDVRVSGEADGCRLTIEDRGPGLPPAHVDRIFERFFSYRPADAQGDHLGLGLAIARRIVDAHGGRIGAGNRPGGGAVFDVWLPAAADA
jgi:two-component system sensor histidine kinase ChvG